MTLRLSESATVPPVISSRATLPRSAVAEMSCVTTSSVLSGILARERGMSTSERMMHTAVTSAAAEMITFFFPYFFSMFTVYPP